MGISGLLPLLKSIQRPIELKKYSGEIFAVDAYGWLHRGAISCAVELAQGKPTRRYVDSVLNRVRMVRHFGITPYLVFDGDYLPSKAATEASRAKRRAESRKSGDELTKAGNSKMAFLEYQKAIDITPEMAYCLIEELKNMGLPYIVAPYEADAQMVYLERQGIVSGILSEDSDLLVFGAKRLLTKLDMHGHCVEINRRDFCACREISLTDWTDSEFRQMAIMSGCDYLDGIGNMGLKTAYRMIRKHKTVDKVVRMLQFDGKFKVHENYLTAFRQAELTFLYQRVFCPVKQQLVFLTEPDSDLDLDHMLFIGHKVAHDVARGVAEGKLSPFTKEPIAPTRLPEKRSRESTNNQNTIGSKSFSPPAMVPRKSPFGKSINEYFGNKQRGQTPQRIPLGSMDPNCFSVDRKQVAALTQNGLVPRIFPLPRPYIDDGLATLRQSNVTDQQPISSVTAGSRILRRQTEPISKLLHLNSTAHTTTLPVSRRTAPSSPMRAQIHSSRPLKKLRLSKEIAIEESHERSLEHSKYFPAPPTSSAPKSDQLQKNKRKCTEQLLMSDDSFEEALLKLPDLDHLESSEVGGSSQSTKNTFSDLLATTKERSSKAGNISDGLNHLNATGEIDFGLQRDDIEVPASPGSVINLHTTETPLIRPLNHFSYAPTTRIVHGLPTPDSVSDQNSTYRFTETSSVINIWSPLSATKRQPSRPRKILKASLGDLISEEQPYHRKSSGKQRRSIGPSGPPVPLNPSFVPLPLADLTEVEALNCPQGSEDQIVPDSDVDDDIDVPNEPETRQLNLSRFLYI